MITSATLSKVSPNPGSCLNPPPAVKATSPSAPSKTLHCTYPSRWIGKNSIKGSYPSCMIFYVFPLHKENHPNNDRHKKNSLDTADFLLSFMRIIFRRTKGITNWRRDVMYPEPLSREASTPVLFWIWWSIFKLVSFVTPLNPTYSKLLKRKYQLVPIKNIVNPTTRGRRGRPTYIIVQLLQYIGPHKSVLETYI